MVKCRRKDWVEKTVAVERERSAGELATELHEVGPVFLRKVVATSR